MSLQDFPGGPVIKTLPSKQFQSLVRELWPHTPYVQTIKT